MTYSEEDYNSILAVCRSYKNDYETACEQLSYQRQEIAALKAENESLKKQVESLRDDIRYIIREVE